MRIFASLGVEEIAMLPLEPFIIEAHPQIAAANSINEDAIATSFSTRFIELSLQ
jgi:hypothetical protein